MSTSSTFQKIIDYVVRLIFSAVYLDEVFVFLNIPEKNFKRLSEVFGKIDIHNLKLKPINWSFVQNQVYILGMIVDINRVFLDPKKIRCPKNSLVPITKTNLRFSLGISWYYRRFIQGFAKIQAPLHA